MTDRALRIGTRRSKLAMWQARHVASELERHGVPSEIVPIVTEGDRMCGSLRAAGGQGLFTKAIQAALLQDAVDVAVHSLKDLATQPVSGLVLAAVPPRAAVHDVLVCCDAQTLADLRPNARIGTGSPRRAAQLKYLRRDLVVVDIRGNVETRLAKLQSEELDAVVLAEAGLVRLQLGEHIRFRLPLSDYLPAAGQGALGIETREDDPEARAAVALLDDPASHAAVVAERAVLAHLQAGCLAPVGVYGRVEPLAGDGGDAAVAGRLKLVAVALDDQGTRRVSAAGEAPPADAEFLGQIVATSLLDEGAADLIAQARRPE